MTELTVGQGLEPYVVDSVDAEKMKVMAAILHDPNPIHFDVEVVRALGYGQRPINQGPINMAWFMACAVHFAGGRDRLLRTQMRFLGGTVTAVDREAGTVELDIECAAGGRPVLAGSATVAIR